MKYIILGITVGGYLKTDNGPCPLCILQDVTHSKEKNIFLLARNSTILDHECRSLTPRKHFYYQYRRQGLFNELHV